jgi:hypothetical protein
MPLRISNLEISPFFEIWGIINVMSSQFFNSIPELFKSKLNAATEKLIYLIFNPLKVLEPFIGEKNCSVRKTPDSCIHRSVKITSANVIT